MACALKSITYHCLKVKLALELYWHYYVGQGWAINFAKGPHEKPELLWSQTKM